MLSMARRALCTTADSLRVLGLPPKPTEAQIKAAWRREAKQWHPDAHSASAKLHAEERFKRAQRAYEALRAASAASASDWRATWREARPGAARAAGGGARGSRGGTGSYWGTHATQGEASRPGYDPYKGYMGYQADGRHWYEDAAEAGRREDRRRMLRLWVGLSVFALGLGACVGTASRDRAAKERGELVDAWFNQSTRRWEKPSTHMYRDPFLSSMIHLKPPSMVYNPTTVRSARPAKAKTLDGASADAAYRAREQGMRG
ncbi:hypothetical protein AB1Y20_008419 [Prymnesium parvum]|uniref:J domain-containing protein n=1 Tax=Prymnesium parvum TaxID=97485 RepID=A0AB34IGL2_PRYPA